MTPMDRALSFLARLACVTCAVFAWGSVLQTHAAITVLLLAGTVGFYQLDEHIIRKRGHVMPNRHTLHRNDLEHFIEWLKSKGWDILPTKGEYEILRARHYNQPRPLLVHERPGVGDHFSIDERDAWIYRAYFNEKRRKHRART